MWHDGSPLSRGDKQPTILPMPEPKLRTVTRTQGNNRALKDGTVKPKTFEFAFEEVDPLIAAFRRMVRVLIKVCRYYQGNGVSSSP